LSYRRCYTAYGGVQRPRRCLRHRSPDPDPPVPAGRRLGFGAEREDTALDGEERFDLLVTDVHTAASHRLNSLSSAPLGSCRIRSDQAHVRFGDGVHPLFTLTSEGVRGIRHAMPVATVGGRPHSASMSPSAVSKPTATNPGPPRTMELICWSPGPPSSAVDRRPDVRGHDVPVKRRARKGAGRAPIARPLRRFRIRSPTGPG